MKTSRQALFVGLCMAASALAAPTIASAGISVDIDVAPPPIRVEAVPEARVGYVWAPGYWDYRGHDHFWVGGRYIAERKGYRYVPDRWEQHGQHWHHEPGHWVH
jgi:WXXGXW repeat (2 copies)